MAIGTLLCYRRNCMRSYIIDRYVYVQPCSLPNQRKEKQTSQIVFPYAPHLLFRFFFYQSAYGAAITWVFIFLFVFALELFPLM